MILEMLSTECGGSEGVMMSRIKVLVGSGLWSESTRVLKHMIDVARGENWLGA